MRKPRSRPRSPGNTGHRHRRRRTALLAGAVTLASGAAIAMPTASQAQPVAAGEPIAFQLTDNQGAWFDTGTDLFGTKSLAVAVLPRTGLEGLPVHVPSLLNAGETGLSDGPVAAGSSAHEAPGSAAELLNLDELTAAVRATGGLLGGFKPSVRDAVAAIGALDREMAGRDAAEPVHLTDLPAGARTMRLLEDLQESNEEDPDLVPTANFTIAPPLSASSHSVTSLIWPAGYEPMDQSSAFIGDVSTTLTEPGLYAWACKIHPYMLGAVVVDDPLTPGVDFGRKLHVNARGGGLTVPSSSDIVMQLVQKFFNITAPSNWQRFSNSEDTHWDPSYPPAPILTYDGSGQPVLIPSLDAYFQDKFREGVTLPALTQRPAVPGVGEVWIDTQMERTAGKEKSGTATRVDVENWTVARKVSLPQINMNNPHNMWSDRSGELIYQTEWFSDRLTVFERKTGELVRTIRVGPDPSHVMTRPDTDQLHVAINGGNAVVELSPGATAIDRRIPVQLPGEKPAHPHAHWMSADSKTMITPNVNNHDATLVNVPDGSIRKAQTEDLPIATSMTPDGKKAYVANFLGQSVSCVSIAEDSCSSGDGRNIANKAIDLWKGYDPVSGKTEGSFGGLPIQLPTSPDGNYVLVANTLTSNIAVISTKTDEVVKYLPCDAGCHGINFGAKKGGGYYGYVSSKFANTLAIVDGDPNGDGDPRDAAVVGKMVLDAGPGTASDDTVVDYAGMGGQGVFAFPNPYNGWVQNTPAAEAAGLTCAQLDPVRRQRCA